MLTLARRPVVHPLGSMATVGALAAVLVLIAWLLSAPPVRAAEVAVDISDFAFQPGTVTIQVGDTVTWTNNDSVAHTATSTDDPALFDGGMAPGESFSFTFTEAGSFAYFCEIHPEMEGTVVVESGDDLPDGAMQAGSADDASPATPFGIALIALSLLAGSVVAWRRARPMQ
jgi:plastocyanin